LARLASEFDKRTGSIEPGMEADSIAIQRDPIADITAIQDVIIVIIIIKQRQGRGESPRLVTLLTFCSRD